ncbi:hypothetical protein [Brevibacillus dissolubilis]|uniref:hypothetical protein n=1 Tax=Brevibacillus dissolubilis TaxID=1844116 RepID=UPI00210023EE|nr:hypothetical protein [Brevibacillus dissolubilis]
MTVTVIQPLLMERLLLDLSGHIRHAQVKVNGQQYIYPIHKTVITENQVTSYVYLNDVEAQGQVENVSLLDSDGSVLAIKPTTITKGDSGLLVAFVFTLKMEVSA